MTVATAPLAPTQDAAPLPARNAEFDALFDGRLYSILSWSQLDEFWARLAPDAGWYVYAIGEARPQSPADPEHLATFLREISALLRREHGEDYCGIVYADDLEQPNLVKIYDPNNLGTVCGSGKERVLPGWVVSRVWPSDLTPGHSLPQNRRRWWQQFAHLLGMD